MKKIKFLPRILLTIITLSQSALAAPPPAWAWAVGKQTSNGAITLTSTNGTTTYSAVQNPTGTNVNVNQNAATQPPLVIIQTSGTLNRWSMYYADRAAGLP